MIKIPISGGPGTGKTTLVEALEETFPQAYFVQEPATQVIDRELSFEATHDDYEPHVPWLDYPKFAPKAIAESERLETAIPSWAKIAFLDRSLVDNIAYGRINGFEDLIPDVQLRIWLARYSFALICQPLEEYKMTRVRRETTEEALHTHEAIERAYKESELKIVPLPPVSVQERVSIVQRTLKDRGLI
ncbi:MAG: ATP-binding protein [Candidatus Saccharimonadales bacterium]